MCHVGAPAPKGWCTFCREFEMCARSNTFLELTSGRIKLTRVMPVEHLLCPLLILIAMVAVCILPVAVSAQLPVSAIRGTISDSTGAPIIRAIVTAKEEETGWVRTTLSQSDGMYQIENL